MPRPTGRGYALLGLAAGTYLAGRLIGTWELYLFGFAFLAAVVVSWLSIGATRRRIQVTRALIPERPVAGDEPELAFTTRNGSFLPGPLLTLRCPLGGLCTTEIEAEIGSLAPHEERLMKARVGQVNRGIHALPAPQIIASDPLGIAQSSRKVGEALIVTVLPQIVHLDSCALYPDMGLKHDYNGRYGLRAIGASEFRGIRPHQPGEPLSHIDWKSTAKTGVLMLREMEEPAGADITMLLDGTAGQLLGKAPENNFELAVRAAGSIADFVLRHGRGVTLVSHERERRESRLTADGGGRRALLQTLAEVQPDARTSLENTLQHLHSDRSHRLRARTITIVSLSLNTRLVQSLVDLRKEGLELALLYIVGPSFVDDAGTSGSYLLPFLPPKEEAGLDTMPASSAHPGTKGPADGKTGRQTSTFPLSAEARSLLLSLSANGIPCLTLARGDDLERCLSSQHSSNQSAATGLTR